MKSLVIAGTDTDIGKTLCSALLMCVLKGTYFKPIQSGGKNDNDTATVRRISELSDNHFLKEKYLLSEPLSPHRAAELDNITINENQLTLPENASFEPLIVELAGGLMVPVNRKTLMIDVFKKWATGDNLRVILCAGTSLGTINHTLLSIEALKNRDIEIAGLVFIGDKIEDNIKTITEFSSIRQLGYIPKLDKIDKKNLTEVFYDNFDISYFRENDYEI